MMMKATPQSVWAVPAYLPYVQPKLTQPMIRAAEKNLGVKLPREYLELLKVQNGGYIRYTLRQADHHCIAGIGPRFPSITHFDWSDARDWVTFKLDGLVPFDGDGHWHLCLDYRTNHRTPCIALVNIESGWQKKIADSFAAYFRMLRFEVDDRAYVLPSVSDIDQIKRSLAKELRVKFYPPNSEAHGYPEHQALCGPRNDPEWIWISPNKVPRGFVRKWEADYRELKDLLPGRALRFPELPESSYILTVTDGARAKLEAACEKLAIGLVPLRRALKARK